MYRFITFLFFSSFMVVADEQSITIALQSDDYAMIVDRFLPEPLFIDYVTFAADVYMPQAEYSYLTDLKDGVTVSAASLKKALFYLNKKKKFEQVIITISCEDHIKKIHMQLLGFWTLKAIKFHGVLLGKDSYRQHYLIEPGDPFDETKHQLSLQRIEEVFAQEGYIQSRITSSLERDIQTKSIMVHLTLKPGKRFSIGSVAIELKSHENIPNIEELKVTLENHFLKRITRSNYSKNMLNKETTKLKQYLAKNGFPHVTVELEEKIDHGAKKINLRFILDIYKKKEFIFSGNHFFTHNQLWEMVLRFGRSLWMVPPTILQQEIEASYRAQGFWDIAVKAYEEQDRYFFIIDEGERASIKKITIKNILFEKSEIVVKEHFNELMQHPFYDEDLYVKGLESLIAWYVSQGFLEAQLLKREQIPHVKNNWYELVLTFQEGSRSYIDALHIPEYPELEQEGPFLAFKQSTDPVPFRMEDVQQQRIWLLQHFQKKNLIAKCEPTFSKDGDKITVQWKVILNKDRGVFGKTVMVGSSTFTYENFMRELRYKPGVAWNTQSLKESLLRLKKLELFETLYLYPDDGGLYEGEQPVIAKIIEDDRFELRARAGFAVQQVSKFLNTAGLTYRVGGAFLIKNPFNRADLFRIDTDFDRSQRAVSVQYQCPWTLGMPIQTIIEGYDNKYQQPGLIGCKKNLYEIFQQGLLLSFMRKYLHCDAGFNVGMEFMETTLQEDDVKLGRIVALELARAINFEPTLLNKKIPYVQIEPTLLLDYLDNNLQPTRGLFTVLSLKGMFPCNLIGSNSYFIRLSAEQSFFIPLGSLVWALRLRFGHIFHRKLNNIMPTERFYLGGANSIRSYETDRCPPLGVFVDETGCPQYVPQGGKTMMNVNLELRFPIIKQFSGVVFQDFGALCGDRFADVFERAPLAGTGFGVRYLTPLGPLRFDVAWKWHKSHPQELAYAWFLSFGNAF